jgi:hypothetical protein
MPRYKLRTLLILLAVGPMVLAGIWYFVTEPEMRGIYLQLIATAIAAVFLLVVFLGSNSSSFESRH